MPIYEYACVECKKIFEVRQKLTDEKLTKCEECGGDLQMLISHSSFKLKGAGFHVNDYGKRGPR